MENRPSVPPLLGNRYQLQQTLGSGGMALVYKAWDLRLERPVAVKLLRQDFSKDEAFRERFRQEARAAANLTHPNIVTVHDFGLDNGRLFIVMEFVPGTDLKTLLKTRGRFSIDEAIPLIVQACAGIGYAHRAGIVHCDVKSHNLIVTPDMRLKVTDFGIARALASIRPDEQYDVVWGSPQYFSPEQASGLAPTLASDVYSLGVILYEMLTGQLPFYSDDATELARLHREAIPVPPRQLNPEIPPSLEKILLKVLSKEPASRYRNADQLGRILLTFSHHADPYASNIPPQPPTNGPAAVTVASIPAQTPLSTPRQAYQHSPSNPHPAYHPTPSRPISPSRPIPSDTQPNPAGSGKQENEIDWGTIALSLFAILVIGGLIPFWMYVFFTFNPPIP